jgi:anti-sigma factor RsiW
MEHPLHRLRFRFDHRWVPGHASPYLDGELSPARRARLQRHLDECPECRALLHELSALVAALGTLHDDDGAPVAKTIFSSLRGRLDEPSRDRP